jgi:hypothetical protein
MKIKYLTFESCGASGAMTLGNNITDHFGGQTIVVSHCTPRSKPNRVKKFQKMWGPGVEVAASDDELVELCKDADIVFCLAFPQKTWPTAKETLQRIPAYKVLGSLGTQEINILGVRWFYKEVASVFDCWWSERPLIRDFNISKGLCRPDIPYVIGCNVYRPACESTSAELVDERDPGEIITNARFSKGKGSDRMIPMFERLMGKGYNCKAWGWKPKEGGVTFLGCVKSKPDMWEAWGRVAPKVAMGTYGPEDIPVMFRSARFAVDMTAWKGDGSLWGDGGLQWCQAEAIDWGCIPIVNRKFYQGDEWDTILHRVDSLDEVDALLEGWDEAKHEEMIRKGKEYVRQNLSLQRFQDSMDEIVRLAGAR